MYKYYAFLASDNLSSVRTSYTITILTHTHTCSDTTIIELTHQTTRSDGKPEADREEKGRGDQAFGHKVGKLR